MRVCNIAAALVAATFVGGTALAQDQAASASTRKPEVKAEARAAAKTGRLAGELEVEGGPPRRGAAASSPTTRADRKAAVRSAQKNGQIAPVGETAERRNDESIRAQPTSRSRADRKAETRAAEKAGTLAPAGESPTPVKK